MRILIMRGVLPAVLLLALAIGFAGSSGEVSAAELNLCEVLVSDINDAVSRLYLNSSTRRHAGALISAMTTDEGLNAAVEGLQEVREFYSKSARELETLLVIRRELGCQKGGV